MDNFSYTYLNIGSAPSNRLGHVSDAVNASANTDDIESQSANNYTYDQLGQLIGDQQELIANIEWRSGDKKIKTLTRTSNAGNKSDMEFVYNPMGQRILKIEKPRVNNVLQTRNWWKYTYYTYDANGQVMATYEVTLSTALNRAYLKDQNIYGASRIGMRNKYIALYENATVPYTIPAVQQNTLGNIAYEITNYLGNVNVVISDRKIWTGTPINAFKACVVSRTDYFPFGMEISSRTTNSDNYRFGYNGMESDNETKGSGNSYTTEFRQYDPRIGRWLSLDPLMAQFPWQSPYCAFDNNPVFFTDPLGLAAEGGGKGDPEKKTQNLQEVKYVYKRTPLQKLKGFMNSIKKSLNNLSANKPAKRQESNPKVKAPSESTNPNIPDYSSIIENQKIPSGEFVEPYRMVQKPMVDRIELSCINYNNYGKYVDPLNSAETTAMKWYLGQKVSLEDIGWSVFELTPAKYLKYGKHLLPKVATQVGKEVGEVVVKGVSVIGPRATYREFAKKIGANFLDVTDEAWSMRKNVSFLQGVVKRGDDVIFAGKYNPLKLDPNSVLAQEIRYLQKHGYSWTDDFSKMIKK